MSNFTNTVYHCGQAPSSRGVSASSLPRSAAKRERSRPGRVFCGRRSLALGGAVSGYNRRSLALGGAMSGCNRRQGIGELGLGQTGVRWQRSLRCREATSVKRRGNLSRRSGRAAVELWPEGRRGIRVGRRRSSGWGRVAAASDHWPGERDGVRSMVEGASDDDGSGWAKRRREIDCCCRGAERRWP